MKLILKLKIAICLIFATIFNGASQTYTLNPYQLGTTCATCIVNNNNSNPKGGGGGNQVMNGNGFIANSYAATACGLNYVIGKVN